MTPSRRPTLTCFQYLKAQEDASWRCRVSASREGWRNRFCAGPASWRLYGRVAFAFRSFRLEQKRGNPCVRNCDDISVQASSCQQNLSSHIIARLSDFHQKRLYGNHLHAQNFVNFKPKTVRTGERVLRDSLFSEWVFWTRLPFVVKQCQQHKETLTPVSSEISSLCKICDIVLFVSYFASQSEGIKFGDYFFDACCVN